MFEMKLKESLRIVCIFLISGASMANGSNLTLLNHIPESANVLVYIDVFGLHSSQAGVAQDTRARHEMNYLRQPIMLPPSASRAVIAGDLDARSMDLQWGLSVIQLLKPVNMDELAQREDGLIDSLAGKKAIRSPLDAYFIELDTRAMATIYPARRQFACRWLRSRQNNTAMPAYLQTAAEYTNEKGNDIVMALDLKDVPDPFYMANSIESSKVLAGTDFEDKTLTKLLSSIEGITLIIKADKNVSGKIIIHFGENTFSIKEYAKDLLLEYLSKTGAYVNDFNDWQANVVGKVVTLEGDMTVDSLRCILSLIEIPTPTNQPVIDSNQPVKDPSRPVKEPNDVAEKSQKYFQAVKLHVDGLRKLARGPSITVYMRKYAVKIENLPILGVDKDLQKYGADVAYYLRAGSDQLRAASNRSLAGQARYHGGIAATRYGRYGGTYVDRSNYAYQAGERKRVTMEEKASGFSNAIDVLREIDIETSQIRRLLTDRYKVEF